MRHTTTIMLLLTLAGGPAAIAQTGQDEALDSRDFKEVETDRAYTGPATLRAASPAREAARAPQAAGDRGQPEAAQELDHDEAAVEILRAVAEAIGEGYVAEVKSYAEGSPMLASTFPKSEGRWAQRATSDDDAEWAVRYIGQGTVMTHPQPIDFDVLWQPDRISWIDHENKVFNVQRPQGKKSGEAYQLASSAFGQASPLATGFAEALESAPSITMATPVEIEGTLCDVVAISAQAGSDPVLWYFGREDRLPRRSEIVLPDNDLISGSIRVDFASGVAGKGVVTADEFTLQAPAGYERDVARIFLDPDEAARVNKPLPSPVNVGAPDWEVADADGNLVNPASLHGKVSLLYFWGTWSPACEKASPELAKLAAEFAGQPVEFLGMAFREGDPAVVADAARAQGQTWRVFPEADTAVKAMGISNAPSFIVLGKQGELLFRAGRPRGSGYAELIEQLRNVITRAVAEEAPSDRSGNAAQTGGPGTRVAPAGATQTRKPVIIKKDE
ncbi:MAG: TlpA family protein disulfide reductase [Phycisphaerales bacterium JB054]